MDAFCGIMILSRTAGRGIATATGFDLTGTLETLILKSRTYSSGFLIFLGIIMIAYAGYKIGKGLMTQGKPQAQPINWFLCLGILLAGGTMAFGGITSIGKIAYSIDATVDDLTGDAQKAFSGGGNTIKEKSEDW